MVNRKNIEVHLIPECAACIVHSLTMLIPLLTSDEKEQFELVRQAMARLSEGYAKRIPPHPLSVRIYQELYSRFGVEDPYAEIKRKSREAALQAIPLVEKEIEKHKGYEQLRMALAAAITGNLIDFNTASHSPNLDALAKDFMEILDQGFAIDFSHHLWRILKSRSGHVVFIGDNAGETIFDIPLLRVIRDASWEITYVVKGGAMVNDATREDIEGTEIEKLANIEDTGAKAHGVPRDLVNQQFLRLLSEANLVIAKGQSNIETLPAIQKELDFTAFYVLKAKCPNIAQAINAKPGDNVVLMWPTPDEVK